MLNAWLCARYKFLYYYYYITIIRLCRYLPPESEEGKFAVQSMATTSIFDISCFQYLMLAFALSRGPPYRKRIWTNGLWPLERVRCRQIWIFNFVQTLFGWNCRCSVFLVTWARYLRIWIEICVLCTLVVPILCCTLFIVPFLYWILFHSANPVLYIVVCSSVPVLVYCILCCILSCVVPFLCCMLFHSANPVLYIVVCSSVPVQSDSANSNDIVHCSVSRRLHLTFLTGLFSHTEIYTVSQKQPHWCSTL